MMTPFCLKIDHGAILQDQYCNDMSDSLQFCKIIDLPERPKPAFGGFRLIKNWGITAPHGGEIKLRACP
jgi:hypothetical protein